jgi:hypothetical protein
LSPSGLATTSTIRALPHPNYFPQAVANPQPAYCYPDIALAEYRQWMHDVYLKDKLKPYLQAAERKGKLPPAFTNTVSYSTFIWTRFDNLERGEGRHSLPRPLSKAFPGLLMPQSSLRKSPRMPVPARF